MEKGVSISDGIQRAVVEASKGTYQNKERVIFGAIMALVVEHVEGTKER